MAGADRDIKKNTSYSWILYINTQFLQQALKWVHEILEKDTSIR